MANIKILKHTYDMHYNDIKNMNRSEEKELEGQPQMLEKEEKIKTETSYTITELREEATVKEERVQFDETETKQVHESFHKAHSSGENTEKKMTDSEHIIKMLKYSEMEYLNLKEDQNKPGSKIGTCVSTHNEVRMSAAETEEKVIELESNDQPIIPVMVAEDSKSIPKESSIENQKESSIENRKDAPSLVDEDNPTNQIAENRESELPTKLEDPREQAETDLPSPEIKIEKTDEIIISESEDLILEVSSHLDEREETQKDSIDKQDVSLIEQGLETEKVAPQSASTDEVITQLKTESAEVNYHKEEVSMNKDAEMYNFTSNKETKSKYKSKIPEKVPMKGDPKKYKKAESVKLDIKPKQSKSILKKYRTNKSHSKAIKENTQLKEVKTVTVFHHTPSRMDGKGIDNEIIASGDNSMNDASVVMQNDKAVEDEVIEDSKIKTLSEEVKQKEGDGTKVEELPEGKKIKIDLPSVEIKRESEKEDFGFHLYGKKNLKGNFVSRVEPGSGADRAGLRVGDKLIMLGDTDVEKMKHAEIVDLIRNMNGPLRVSVANELQVLQQAREGKDQKDQKGQKDQKDQKDHSKLELSSMEEARPKPKRANKANQDKSWKERKALFKNL